MKRKFPLDYNYFPRTFLLSSEYDRFITAMQEKEKHLNKKSIWIIKPVASACGRGIKLMSKKHKI